MNQFRLILAAGTLIFAGIGLPWPTSVQAGDFNYVPSDAVYRMTKVLPIHFLDVRGTSAYSEEHIKGALDAPLMMLRRGKIPDLDKKATVVTYCGCPHAMAEDAAGILVAAGFSNVIVLDDGFYAWKDRGYPIEKAKVPKKFRKMKFEGKVGDLSLAGKKIEVVEPVSDQREIATIGTDGHFALHMPFYGEIKNQQVTFSVGPRTWQRPLQANNKLILQ